jgi:ribulose-phosphate 3-epimerase
MWKKPACSKGGSKASKQELCSMEHLLAPSILAADFANLQRDIEMINSSNADWFHLDIMDGVFVPNISFGMPVIAAIGQHAKKPLDVHLMIVDPDRYIGTFHQLGASVLTVHYEACTHLHRTLQAIRDLGMKAGVALNPHTPVTVLEDIMPSMDLVCLMSVNPGFGGQKFIDRTYEKVRRLRSMANLSNPDLYIEIDGGVGTGNWRALVESGANVLVAGSSTFNASNPMEAIDMMKGY